MNIRLEDNYKQKYTVEEYEQAKNLIEAMRNKVGYDSVKPFVKRALGGALGIYDCYSIEKILCTDAYTAKKCGIHNKYGEDIYHSTGEMDVYIVAYAEAKVLSGIDEEYIIIRVGGYLSDIDSGTGLHAKVSKSIFVEDY